MMKKRVTSSKKLRKKQKKSAVKTVSVEELIRNGDEAMYRALDVERAHSQYSAAATLLKGKIEMNVPPEEGKEDNETTRKVQLIQVLSKLGETKVSLGDPEGAREDFELAVSMLPEKATDIDEDGDLATSFRQHELRASLYLYLGQLSCELEALDNYKKGVDELQECIRVREQLDHQKLPAKPEDGEAMIEDDDIVEEEETSIDGLRRQLVGAYCSIAELYLTDLCFEESAELECERVVQLAVGIIVDDDGQPCVDALQAMANLRLSQQQKEEACRCALQAYDKMKKGCEALAALVGLRPADEDDTGKADIEEATELVDVDAADGLPGFEFRCQSVKILLECSAGTDAPGSEETKKLVDQCARSAIQVVGSLLAENDEVIEVWYLAGCAFAASKDTELATQYWERALEMLHQVRQGLEVDESEDAEEQLSEVEQQVEEISTKLKEIGAGDDSANDDIVMDGS